jgi:hypothetical protein
MHISSIYVLNKLLFVYCILWKKLNDLDCDDMKNRSIIICDKLSHALCMHLGIMERARGMP